MSGDFYAGGPLAQAAAFVGTTYLAEVVAVNDPERRARVQLRLFNADGLEGQDAPIWARVAVPFAGSDRGAFLIPDVGDEVLVTFVNGDPRSPIVMGGLWNGRDAPPETLGGTGDRVDRWTITGTAGTRIAIVEETRGQEEITLTLPSGAVKATLTDANGGKVELEAAGATITIDTQGVTVVAPSKVKVQTAQVEVSAGMVKVDAALSQFSGIVKCDVLQATTVIATTYTPGAGNVW